MKKFGIPLSKTNIFIVLLSFALTFIGQMLGMVLEAMRIGSELTTVLFLSSVRKGAAYGAAAAVICAAVIMMHKRPEFTVESVNADDRCCGRQLFLVSIATILLCWIPCFIAYYPAIYSYDGEPQLIQYTTGAFDNHHPVFHTLVMGWCYDLGRMITASVSNSSGSTGIFESFYLDGMAIYAVLQMLLLAGAYAGVIALAYRLHVRRVYRVLLILWFALFPVHPLMAITTTKDSMYTGALVIFLTGMAEILKRADTIGIKNCILPLIKTFFGIILMMLCRKNGFYMMCGTTAVLLIYTCVQMLRSRTGRQKGLISGSSVSICFITCLLAMMTAVITENALLSATGAVQGESAEALSIPLQQLARAYKSNTDDFSIEDLEEIAEYESIVGLNNYRPFISDVVKQNFNNEKFRDDPIGFIRIWLKYGRRYPGSYLMAVLYHTMGAWYPDDISHTIVYADWWRNRTGYLITDAIPVFAQRFVVKENLWPAVRDLYERIATECVHQKFVVTRIVFSPFLYCILTVIFFVAALVDALSRKSSVEISGKNTGPIENEKDAGLFILMTPLFIHYLMILAGPCVIIRYIYPLMSALPVVFIVSGTKKLSPFS